MDEIIAEVIKRPRKKLVVAYANDTHSVEAVNKAVDLGIVDGILIGDEKTIIKNCNDEKIDYKKFTIVDESDEIKATNLAVKYVNDKKADFLMKGLVSTDKYMRAILNKETGLLPPKAVLTHISVLELEKYHKLLVVSDVAIIPAPDLSQKVAIANYVISTCRQLGIERPKIAMIAPTEQVSTGIQSCVDAAIIAKMGDRGQIKNADIDGPLALDVALDEESVKIKNITGPVAGNADGLVFPNLEAGNIFYKFSTKLANNTKLAAILVGAKCPAVLSSRGDSSDTKTYSIALAALMSK